jgi:TetR/AcrR family transcriptional regulator, cholesterol catabolism regulator
MILPWGSAAASVEFQSIPEGVRAIPALKQISPAVVSLTSPRPNSGTETRERLREIALDLFWKNGYRSTSTRDIASSLGVKQASVYYHVKNKEELLYDICYSSLLQVIQSVEASAASANNPVDALRSVARTHLTATLTLQKQFLISMYDYRSLSKECLTQINEFWGRYEAFVSSIYDTGIGAGLFRTDVLNRYHYHLLMSMTLWSVLWFQPGRELSIGELSHVFAEIYIEGAGGASSKRGCGPQASNDFRKSILLPDFEPISVTKNETHARLLDTASTLFASRGYTTTSIREIAEAMGIEKASLYYYLDSKEDLCYQITKAAHEHLISGVKSVLERTSGPEARLYALITSHVVWLLQHQHWHATANEQINALSAPRRQKIVAMRDGYESLVRQIVKDAQNVGILRADIPAKYLSFALLGIITLIYPWYEPDVDIAPIELGLIFADVFIHGVVCRVG